jgi:hypothetical protein
MRQSAAPRRRPGGASFRCGSPGALAGVVVPQEQDFVGLAQGAVEGPGQVAFTKATEVEREATEDGSEDLDCIVEGCNWDPVIDRCYP